MAYDENKNIILEHTRPPGRPRGLTPEVQKRLIDVMRLGVPAKTAAENAGIHVNTLWKWLRRGYAEAMSIEAGNEPDDDEAVFFELYQQVNVARSEATIRNVGLVQKAAQGGFVTKVTEKKYKDVETGRIVTEVSEDIAGPDWRAAAWYLERANPDEFGKNAVQVEVTDKGSSGETSEQIAGLAERLAQHIAANPAVAAIAATQVPASETDPDTDESVDAELVE